MQLPVGGLVDRFGAHRLIIITTALFGCACFLFASASEVMMLKIARLIMGFAGSFAFISTFKLAMIWFPPSMLGLLAGITIVLRYVRCCFWGRAVSTCCNFDWLARAIISSRLYYVCFVNCEFIDYAPT